MPIIGIGGLTSQMHFYNMKTSLVYPTEEQENMLRDFLKANKIEFAEDSEDEKLPPHVIAGIARGQADFDAKRFITLEEFKRKYPC